MVRNLVVKSKEKIITIKSAEPPSIGIRHPKKSMGMIAEKLSTQITGFGSSFKY